MNPVVVNIEQWQLFVPIIVLGGVLGWIRGWREMAIFVVGLIFALLVADAIQTQVPTVLERLVKIGGELGPALTNQPTPAPKPPPGFLEDPHNVPLIMLILFFFLALAAYAIGKAIGTRGHLGLFGKIGGFLFGAIGFIIIISRELDYWVAYQTARGSAVAPNGFQTSSPQVVIPSVQVQVAGLPVSNVLSGWYPWAIAAFIILILLYALSRVSRASA